MALPLLLGSVILWWTYRNFDFSRVSHVLWEEMDWGWMLLSIPFGILAQMFRGWRWKQTLEPMGEHPKTSHCVNSIFVSYAANLLLPRVGEVSRCGVLKRYDGVSFSKSLGTVVTERIIDTICILLITGVTLLTQMGVFSDFFKETGTDLSNITARFATIHYIILGVSVLAIAVLLIYLINKLAVLSKVKAVFRNLCEGIFSLKKVRNKWLFVFYTIAIWTSYILHFYLTFYAFEFTSELGVTAGLVLFVVGSIAVVVPTPNGAGPWHFAVITMLVLYGVGQSDAEVFALLVHAIQTLLIIILGVVGWLLLNFEKPIEIKKDNTHEDYQGLDSKRDLE